MNTSKRKTDARSQVKVEGASSLSNPQWWDIHQAVTDQILAAMEQAKGIGRRLWDAQPSLPMNLSTGKPYSGINVIMLWGAAMQRGYTSPYWLTYKQAEAMGGQVRKGEHSELCLYYKPWESHEINQDTGEDETKRGAVLKSFRVFNLDQIDGIEAPATEARPAFQVLADAERILRASPAPIREGGAQACYIPSRDEIHLPNRADFINPEAFYSTALHDAQHRPRLALGPRLLRTLRRRGLCLRGTGRRTRVGFSERGPRDHRQHPAGPRRLFSVLDRDFEERQAGDFDCGRAGLQGARLHNGAGCIATRRGGPRASGRVRHRAERGLRPP